MKSTNTTGILDCDRQNDHPHTYLEKFAVLMEARWAPDAAGYIDIHESSAARRKFTRTHGVRPVRDYDGYLAQMCDITEALNLTMRTASRQALLDWYRLEPAAASRALRATHAKLLMTEPTGEYRRTPRWLEFEVPSLCPALHVQATSGIRRHDGGCTYVRSTKATEFHHGRSLDIASKNAEMVTLVKGSRRRDGWFQLRDLTLREAVELGSKAIANDWEVSIRPTRSKNKTSAGTIMVFIFRTRPLSRDNPIVDATYLPVRGYRSKSTPALGFKSKTNYDAGWAGLYIRDATHPDRPAESRSYGWEVEFAVMNRSRQQRPAPRPR